MIKNFLILSAVGIGIYLFMTTQSAKSIIKKWEGLKLEPYQDAAGYWTIGYGHKIVKGDPYYPEGTVTKISEAEADALLDSDMAKARSAVLTYTKVPLSQNQLDALTSFVFNVGAGAYRDSTLLAKLNANDFLGAASEFGRWVHAKGQVLAGLVNRRNDEAGLFLS